MDDFTAKMVSGLLLMTSGIAQWDEMTDDRLSDFEAQLNVIGDAITYEKELREAALEAAGGRDVQGDTNRAQKIKVTPESAAEYINGLKV